MSLSVRYGKVREKTVVLIVVQLAISMPLQKCAQLCNDVMKFLSQVKFDIKLI